MDRGDGSAGDIVQEVMALELVNVDGAILIKRPTFPPTLLDG
jgi:hypothetical protein